VKRYSSGMQVRLGFAVAAHLDPEIMVVDEVLAVGDAGFQRRCLGRMGAAAREGRTVLFVSHNMEAVSGLCARAVWLDRGRVRLDGPANAVVQAYLAESLAAGRSAQNWPEAAQRDGSGKFRFASARLVDDASDAEAHPVLVGQDVALELEFEARPDGREHLSVWIWVRSAEGRMVTTFATRMMGRELDGLPARGTVRCRIPRFPLGPGTYVASIVAALGAETADQVDQALVFEVAPGDFYGSGTSLTHDLAFLCDHDWAVRPAVDPQLSAPPRPTTNALARA
jgi:lipopolysaccharide transport system ATP-binding protein